MTVKKDQKAFTLCHLKLLIRLALLLSAAAIHIVTGDLMAYSCFLALVWITLFVDGLLKLFPLKYEAMGSQKQFKKNFAPAKDKAKAKMASGKKVILVAALWVVLNAIIAHLYFKSIIDAGIMVIISLFYSVCDMVCILFYCPFQQILGNKCCTTCRIYNWDYIMMFTPLMFIGNAFGAVLVVLGIVIFIRWEYTAIKHPERFCEETNDNLKCARCTEKRCSRKIM
ncbi:MAG: hypothetical protein IJC69_06315 [Clostridia bacterium]|nr:hypothetical protein [Clostridia bacterium]